MSEPILEPEEIEALMAEVRSSEHAEAVFESLPPVTQPEHVDAFHFDDADEDSPDRYPMFVNLQERMVEMLDEDWDELFKRDVTIQLSRIEGVIYKDIITTEKPQVYFVFEVEGQGRVLFTFDTPLIVAFVDAMLGGDGESTDNPQTLSPVELRLSQRIAEKMAALLGELWQPLYSMTFTTFKVDYDPQFLAVTGAMEKCFTANFEAKLSDELTGQMSVHYPLPFLDPMLDTLRVAISDEPSDSDSEWSRALTDRIAMTAADVCFELGRCHIDIGTFLTLKPGDALPLSVRANEACTLSVEGAPMFLARPGEQQGVLAAEIIEPIRNGG